MNKEIIMKMTTYCCTYNSIPQLHFVFIIKMSYGYYVTKVEPTKVHLVSHIYIILYNGFSNNATDKNDFLCKILGYW
jgi:hypothetical protein